MANSLEILFVGLCMFIGEGDQKGRTVVLPYLPHSSTVVVKRGTTCVEPHVAYVSAAASAIKGCDECETMPNGTRILRLRAGEKLSISGITGPDYDELPSFGSIPKMQDVCGNFLPRIPPDAVTLAIGQAGKLERVPDPSTRERYSRLTVDTNGDIVVTATRGGVSRTMTLRAGTPQLTIGNRYANVFEEHRKDRRPLADNHWLAFYTLAANTVICDLPEDDEDHGPEEHAHGSVETTIACSNSQYP